MWRGSPNHQNVADPKRKRDRIKENKTDSARYCPECGHNGELVLNEQGKPICTDCHFEELCQERERLPGPALP